ncbi:MAG: vWA domain-containing protein [Candidatus Saccharimonadales bacterium]
MLSQGVSKLILPLASLVLMVSIIMVAMSQPVTGQSATTNVCRIALALDRSLSIDDNLNPMKIQLMNMFDRFAGSSVEIAFWTFSHSYFPQDPRNYNRYSHTYEKPGDSIGRIRFETALNQIDLDGQTNYEQALGYNNGVPSNFSPVKEIRNDADVIAIVTDGVPNFPGNQNPNDAINIPNQAEVSSREAVLRLEQDNPGIVVIGNTIGVSQKSMNYMINGDKNNPTNVGTLSYETIEQLLRDRIDQACRSLQPNYSLSPKTNVNNTEVKDGDTIEYSYSVNNNTDETSGATSGWQIYDVIMPPSIPGNPLNFNGYNSGCATGNSQPYCNVDFTSNLTDNCTKIISMMSGSGTCNPVPPGGSGTCGPAISTSPGSGNDEFISGDNFFYSPPRCQTISSLPLGTRICSMIAVTKPDASSSLQRLSNAACVTIGKKTPLVQVHGGDVRVGRQIKGGDVDLSAGVYTSQFRVTEDSSIIPNGRTYGSWGEYGVLAPGPIKNFASSSGFNGVGGGYDDLISHSDCDKNINLLTFANMVTDPVHDNECGYLSETPGIIPDIVPSLTFRSPVSSSATSINITGGIASGLYKNEVDGNVDINGGVLPKGKSIIVYVPNGTVTVKSDVKYEDGVGDRYISISEIPQLVIIAKNINIERDVVRLDAWLDAIGNEADGGNIDTCSNFISPFSISACDKQLIINGPVMGRQLNLWRTKVDTSASTCLIRALEDCEEVGVPAEIINLPGSSILWTMGYRLKNLKADTTYTTELPPLF